MTTDTETETIAVKITNGKPGRPLSGDKHGKSLHCYVNAQTAILLEQWEKQAGCFIPKMTAGKLIDLLAGFSMVRFQTHLDKAGKLASGKAVK
jgi:hypothetical protein